MTHKPGYLTLLETGELHERAKTLSGALSFCTICPRSCGVDRVKGENGFCRSGRLPIVASHCAHHGEEPVLSGTRGSGAIFFGNCNLMCVFCQNHQISQPGESGRGRVVGIEKLSDIMLELQSMGCHNINLVSPTHFAPQIIMALEIAASGGLNIPLIYNSNGYDSIETLRLLDGIIDIYLPDLKYGHDSSAKEYSKTADYVRHAKMAIMEMKRQVGGLILDDEGLASKGIIIRHLVLPNDVSGSEEVLKFISEEIGRDTFVSIMSQYFPTHSAGRFPLISRSIRESEYEKVLEWLGRCGLENGWTQEHSSKDYYCPDFKRERPFME